MSPLEPPAVSAESSKQSHLISSVLSPALRLWLRSQVEQVETLQVKIESGDRQILSGKIQRAFISAQGAVYQGLHLSQIQMVGENIRVNLGQVLRGKPLRLLEPVPVTSELRLQESDLNASLKAPLLANALAEFLAKLLQSEIQAVLESPLPAEQAVNLDNSQIVIESGQLTISAALASTNGTTTPIFIRTGLELENSHTLRLKNPQWLTHLKAKRGLPLGDLDNFMIDLGPEVDLEVLTLEPGEIRCCGKITVIPAEP